LGELLDFMKIKTIGLTVTLGVALAGALFWARQQRANARTQLYGEAISYIESSTKPGETIGYLSSHEFYLFYGKNFDRKVVYVPFTKKQSLSEWMKSVRAKKVTAIAVGRLINDARLDRDEIYKRLLQAEKEDKIFRVAGRNQDPRRQSIVYRLSQQQ
jgi:hypothetical protein